MWSEGEKENKKGRTLLSEFLNTRLGEVMTMEEGKEEKFLIQVSFLFYNNFSLCL